MSTVINTNLASLFAQNSLSNAPTNLAKSVPRLSSGLRINSAKDDAAGLAISQNMQSQINGTNQSVRNLNDATNLLQTADTSLSTIQDMLLRLKQLATQGYDGSLSTGQKLNIVQEMKDLNNEINATAQRTAFNGIKLLTSGSTVDLNNSDIKSGNILSSTAVTVSSSGVGDGVALNDDALGAKLSATAGSSDTSYTIALDSEMLASTPGTYTFTSNGANLTMTGTFNGLAQSQTVVVADATANPTAGGAKTTNQTLDFSNFGVKLNLTSVRGAGDDLIGSKIASAIAAKSTLTIAGNSAEITDVRLSGVAPGSYKLSEVAGTRTLATSVGGTGGANSTTYSNVAYTTSGTGTGGILAITTGLAGAISTVTLTGGSGYSEGDTLTLAANAFGSSVATTFTITNIAASEVRMSGTINGVETTESVVLAAGVANKTQTVNFATFGVQFDIKSYQNADASEIGGELVSLNGGTPSTAGQLVVSAGNNSALKFQSGPSSSAFIQIDTLNVQTGTTGITAGQASEMMTLGKRIADAGAGNLGALGQNDTIETWQTAFRNAAAAVDNAIDYISDKRATFGSQMNRLSFVSTNLQAQSTNLQQSRSAMMDTDFAAETAKLTKGQIMQQAATAMLAQANQMPNVILSLLK